MKKLFTIENFELGMALMIIMWLLILLLSVVGLKLFLLLPVTVLGMFILGFVSKHIIQLIEKIKNK